MRLANVFIHERLAGQMQESAKGKNNTFTYIEDYSGPPISLTMPVAQRSFDFDRFPPFFDGLLPEGPQLEGLLKTRKIDRDDYFGQLIAVGNDLVGAVTVQDATK
jgi:serine/threonine-protein kinase HipA